MADDKLAKVERHLSRWNTISGLAQRIGQAVLAASPYVKAAFPALLLGWLAVMNWLTVLPFWVTVPIALVTAFLGGLVVIVVVRIFTAITLAKKALGVETIDIVAIGQKCTAFAADYLEFMTNRVDTAPDRFARLATSDARAASAATQEAWARTVAHNQKTQALVVQKFQTRAMALAHLLKTSGVPAPDLWAIQHGDAGMIAAHFGVLGNLLEQGLLKAACELDPRELLVTLPRPQS